MVTLVLVNAFAVKGTETVPPAVNITVQLKVIPLTVSALQRKYDKAQKNRKRYINKRIILILY